MFKKKTSVASTASGLILKRRNDKNLSAVYALVFPSMFFLLIVIASFPDFYDSLLLMFFFSFFFLCRPEDYLLKWNWSWVLWSQQKVFLLFHHWSLWFPQTYLVTCCRTLWCEGKWFHWFFFFNQTIWLSQESPTCGSWTTYDQNEPD